MHEYANNPQPLNPTIVCPSPFYLPIKSNTTPLVRQDTYMQIKGVMQPTERTDSAAQAKLLKPFPNISKVGK